MIDVPSAISCRRDGINYVGDGISWKVAQFRSLGERISVLVASISGKEECVSNVRPAISETVARIRPLALPISGPRRHVKRFVCT